MTIDFSQSGKMVVNLSVEGTNIKQNNMSAAVAPTVDDDSGDGYSVGSIWYDTTAKRSYVCLDVSPAAAVWKEVTGSRQAAFDGGALCEVGGSNNHDTRVSDTGAAWQITDEAARVILRIFKNTTIEALLSPDDLLLKDQFMSAAIPLSQTGHAALAGTPATSIIGALNMMQNAEVLTSADDTNVQLTASSRRCILVTGAGVNYMLILPDADDLVAGSAPFVISNASAEIIGVRNSDSTVWLRVMPSQTVVCRVVTIASAAGTWHCTMTAAPVEDDHILVPPAAFTAAVPSTMLIPTVIDNGGIYSVVSGDAESLKPANGITYYIATTGNDSTGDGSSGNPWKTLNKAAGTADCRTIIMASGTYPRASALNSVLSPARDLNIVCPSGTAKILGYDLLTWTPDGTYTNTYKATRSGVSQVFDNAVLQTSGAWTPLELAADIGTCDSTAGSWYTDGTYVWVNPLAGSSVTTNTIICSLGVKTLDFRDANLYIENISTECGSTLFSNTTADRKNLIAKNCSFSHSHSNGVTLQGGFDCYFENSSSFGNNEDGFNYHQSSGYIPATVEIDCTAYGNGLGDDNTSNASSMHDAGSVMRVQGVYTYSHGPNVADVNTSYSWNVGCKMLGSRALANNSDAYTDGYMWMDDCALEDYENDGGSLFATRTTTVIGLDVERYGRT